MQRFNVPPVDALVSFEAAARHGGFSRAATELNLTQGAVSRQIQKLEERIGIALFKRVRQRVVLTDAGRAYLPDVQRILRDLEVATDSIRRLADAKPRLNVAVQPTVATCWLIPRLPAFLEANPQLDLNLAVCTELSASQAEQYDLAIQHGEVMLPGLECELLFENRSRPVCSPEFKRTNKVDSIDDLLRVKRLHQTTRREAWSRWFAQVGLDAEQAGQGVWLERIPMIIQATVSGLGVGLLPQFLIEQELRSGALLALSERDEIVSEGYFLIQAVDAAQKNRPFVEWIRHERDKTKRSLSEVGK